MTIFYSENKTQFLVPKEGKILDCSFSDLFQKIHFRNESKEVLIPKTTLYVRDALGWTKLSKIKVVENQIEPLKLITNNKCVYTTTTILIPVYTNKIIRGFHGEIKYACNFKSIDEISDDDLIMFFDYNNDKICQLSQFKIEKYLFKIQNIENQKFTDVWFEIQTASEFFNLNGIQLHV